MNNQTKQKYSRHVEKLANSMKADQNGNLVVYDLMPEHEQHFLKSLSHNSFFGLINLVRSQFAVGDCLGVQVPMPSTTDTDTRERSPERGYIVPRQRFNCEQINIDSFINYAKLDALADYLDTDFESELNNALDKQTLFSLLMVGFNGTSRSPTSDPTTHKLAEDVKKGWLQQLKEQRPSQIINGATVGDGKQYKTLNALVKAGLAKLQDPYKNSADLIAVCGRNILADYPINVVYSDFDTDHSPRITISQKQIGGLKAIGVPYFPENGILITRLDNLSLYVHTGTIRRMLNNNPAKDRLDTFFSMCLDFIIEDYNAAALIENIEITE